VANRIISLGPAGLRANNCVSADDRHGRLSAYGRAGNADPSVLARLVNLANGVVHTRLGHSQELCLPGGIMDIERPDFPLAQTKSSSAINGGLNGETGTGHATWLAP